MERPFKALGFFSLLLALAGLALGLSLYKVAVANAYLRLKAVQEGVPAEKGDATERLRGQHLVAVMGCQDCHGPKLAGQVVYDAPGYLVATAPNLTPRGRVAGWRAAQWHHALRLGVDAEWRALWWMPRATLLGLAESDVVALGAYLQTLPPVENVLPQSHVGLRGYVDVALRRLHLVDRTPLQAADANARWPLQPPTPQEPAFGPYLALVGRCNACHGEGGPKARSPNAAVAKSLRATEQTEPSFADFDRGLRDGRCPDGKSEAERGAPSRMRGWSQQESRALFATLRGR